MVFQDESRTSWFWPLARLSAGKGGSWPLSSPREEQDEADAGDCARAFDIAETLEEGLAREVVTDYLYPLRRSNKLWRFQVRRSEDRREYRLFSEDGAFLMYAQAAPENHKVLFYLYDPNDRNTLFDAHRPAFTMSFNEARTDWRLVQEKCENCQFLPKHLSCACCGKQQVAYIRHEREEVGDGIYNAMEVVVPGLYPDERRVIWCPRLGRGDLSLADENCDSFEAQHLSTKRPQWNDEVDSLVLDFKGRDIASSAKNFQLTPEDQSGHVICQYGKLGRNKYSLDFRYPLSVAQAFGISLTTMFWK